MSNSFPQDIKQLFSQRGCLFLFTHVSMNLKLCRCINDWAELSVSRHIGDVDRHEDGDVVYDGVREFFSTRVIPFLRDVDTSTRGIIQCHVMVGVVSCLVSRFTSGHRLNENRTREFTNLVGSVWDSVEQELYMR